MCGLCAFFCSVATRCEMVSSKANGATVLKSDGVRGLSLECLDESLLE